MAIRLDSDSFISLDVPKSEVSSGDYVVDEIMVTGEFDKWEALHYRLFLGADDIYRVSIPLSKDREDIIFKFRINGDHWTTFSLFATTWDKQGHLNNVVRYSDYQNMLDETGGKGNSFAKLESTIKCTEEATKSNVSNKERKINRNKNNFKPAYSDDSKEDYINLSSNGELSSVENLEIDIMELEGNIEDTIQIPQNNHGGIEYKTMFNLVAVTKKMRTFLNKR